MPLVKHVHNGHHVHTRAVSVGGIYIVIDCNEAYAVGGEYVVEVLSDHNIISAEAGEIFYHNCVYPSSLGVVQQPLYFRSFKVSTRKAVVHVLVHKIPAAFGYILLQDEPLIIYRKRFASALVVFGKS